MRLELLLVGIPAGNHTGQYVGCAPLRLIRTARASNRFRAIAVLVVHGLFVTRWDNGISAR